MTTSIENRKARNDCRTDRVATEYFKVDYIFWSTEEPYYSNDVLTFMREAQNRASSPAQV